MAYKELQLTNYQTVIDAGLLNYFQTGIKEAHNMIEGFRIEYVGRTTDTEGRVVDQYKVIVPSGEEYSFNVTGGKDGAPGAKGEQGLPGNITLNGAELKFFVGKKADYDNLPSKENVFAIITDDPTQVGVVDAVNGFLNGTLPVPAAANDGNNENIAQTYVRKDETKIFTKEYTNQKVQFGTGLDLFDIPEGKTIDDIVGIGFKLRFSFSILNISFETVLYYSCCKVNKISANSLLFKGSSVEHNLNISGTTLVNPVALSSVSLSVYLTSSNKVRITFAGIGTTLMDANNYVTNSGDSNSGLLESITYWFA